MHRRQEDINQHFDCTLADLSAMRWLPRLGADNALMTFDGGRAEHTPLFDQFLDCAKGHAVGLVITDTLADVFSGNENDRGHARQFAQSALGHIARETGAATLALAHPSLAGAANGSTGSGSTGWLGTFRAQLYLESPKLEADEDADADLRVLRRAKANFARRDETIEIKWQAGVFVPLHARTGIIASIERRSCEGVFLDLLDRMRSEKRHISDSNRAGNYAPKLFSKQPDRERFTKKDFETAMQNLFARDEIVIETYKDGYRNSHAGIARTK